VHPKPLVAFAAVLSVLAVVGIAFAHGGASSSIQATAATFDTATVAAAVGPLEVARELCGDSRMRHRGRPFWNDGRRVDHPRVDEDEPVGMLDRVGEPGQTVTGEEHFARQVPTDTVAAEPGTPCAIESDPARDLPLQVGRRRC
jgi:hypothetical protein